MDIDQMLEAWRAQNTALPYDVNRDALRQTLQAEDSRVRRLQRLRRRTLWFFWILGAGMATWAAFWIAITISNGWPVLYAIAAAASFGLFALGVGSLWMSRGRRAEPKRNFGSTLQEEVRRSLALVEHQLSLARHWISFMLGAASIVAGAMLFSWTVSRSQGIADSSFSNWWLILLVVVFGWSFSKGREEMRAMKPKLELRRRHLRELLAALDAGD